MGRAKVSGDVCSDPNYVATPYWEGRDEKYTPEWTEATRENGKKYLSLKVGDISDRENLAATDCAFWHKLMPTLHEEFQYVIGWIQTRRKKVIFLN